jgi:hypothetical protein
MAEHEAYLAVIREAIRGSLRSDIGEYTMAVQIDQALGEAGYLVITQVALDQVRALFEAIDRLPVNDGPVSEEGA